MLGTIAQSAGIDLHIVKQFEITLRDALAFDDTEDSLAGVRLKALILG